MKTIAVVAVAVIACLAGLALGISIGGRARTAGAAASDLAVISFSGERAALAFDEMKPEDAWRVLEAHRLLVTSKGASLGGDLRHLELMLTDARLALLAKQLNKDDRTWRTEAALECGRAAIKDCAEARLEHLAQRRSR